MKKIILTIRLQNSSKIKTFNIIWDSKNNLVFFLDGVFWGVGYVSIDGKIFTRNVMITHSDIEFLEESLTVYPKEDKFFQENKYGRKVEISIYQF